MLEMRLVATQFGLGIPKTKIGASMYGAYFNFNVHGWVYQYGIQDFFEAGSASGQLVLGYVNTNWFSITADADQAAQLANLNGKVCELSVSGIVPFYGSVDIGFTAYDENGSPFLSLTKIDEPAEGVLAIELKLRNTARLLGKTPYV